MLFFVARRVRARYQLPRVQFEYFIVGCIPQLVMEWWSGGKGSSVLTRLHDHVKKLTGMNSFESHVFGKTVVFSADRAFLMDVLEKQVSIFSQAFNNRFKDIHTVLFSEGEEWTNLNQHAGPKLNPTSIGPIMQSHSTLFAF